ncbi:hypothetical protein Pelo_13752 [Pelomyxa schiedti]|nr:hypothetical protein Pelo_13752 [Pelomyxa schiedti]
MNGCIAFVVVVGVWLGARGTLASVNYGNGCGTCELEGFQGYMANTALYGPLDEQLVASNDVYAQYRSQCVRIPYLDLQKFFAECNNWCLWDGLFGPVETSKLIVGGSIIGQFNIVPTIDWPAGTALLPPTVGLVNETQTYAEYGWTYNFTDSTDNTMYEYGRHNYAMGALTDTETCFVSWEKAAGPYARKYGEEISFTLDCATISAMDGVRCLEEVYSKVGTITSDYVEKYCHVYTGFGCDKLASDATDCYGGRFPFPV